MDDRKILELYPLPIARGYRRYLNATEVKERHDLGYFLFEIYLKYLASAVIAGYLAGEERDHRVNAALKGLLRPSLGEWVRFLRECLCIWFQSLDPQSKRPVGAPEALYHFHSARRSPTNVSLADLELSVARDKIVINLGELTGNIWLAELAEQY